MVNSGGGFQVSGANLLPGVRILINIHDPNIINRHSACISPEDHQKRFTIDEAMSITLAWSVALNGNLCPRIFIFAA